MPLLSRESWDIIAPRAFSQSALDMTPANRARAMLETPGRFRSPLTFIERMELIKIAYAREKNSHSFQLNAVRSILPPNWQPLERYLFQSGIIEKSGYRWASIANDDVFLPIGKITLAELDPHRILGTAADLAEDTAISKTLQF